MAGRSPGSRIVGLAAGAGRHPGPDGLELLGRHDRELDVDAPDSRQRCEGRGDPAGDLRSQRAAGHGQGDGHRHPAAPDVDPADHVQLHDADVQLGVGHGPQGLHHLVLAERHPVSFGGVHDRCVGRDGDLHYVDR